ncbi:MAG: type VI secretion system tip protein VgrG [Desulfobacterium sp.]|nr:type VI secretion system tip protein VgrG [Desulfobacterium sp.]MBI9092141.1 type VI secretion system tip protein VgrG [Desulfobacterium sp.]
MFMLTQKNKVFSIETPLGKDVLLLDRFTGQEGLSENFHFDLDLFSEQNSISVEGIIGKNVTISILLSDGNKRFLNGLISCFSQVQGNDYRASYYSATMVPWSWLLTRTTNSRIFQNLSVPDIVEKVFQDKGFINFKFNLSATYEPREYTVQYRETDFNFVSRLLEDEGIYYYFEHGQGKHTMILADRSGTSKPCPTQASAKFKQSGEKNFEN